jgi:hypothetical protein
MKKAKKKENLPSREVNIFSCEKLRLVRSGVRKDVKVTFNSS